jgi:hypothetical protein
MPKTTFSVFFVYEVLTVHLFLLIIPLGKSLSEKCIESLSNYRLIYIKSAKKGGFPNFYFFIFHPILMCLFLQIVDFYWFLMGH